MCVCVCLCRELGTRIRKMTQELGTWKLTGDLTKSPVNWKLFWAGNTSVIPKNQFLQKSPIPIKYTPLLTLIHTKYCVYTLPSWVPSYSWNSQCYGSHANNQFWHSCKWHYISRSQTDAICIVPKLLNPLEGMVPNYGQISWVPSSRHKHVWVRLSVCVSVCGHNFLSWGRIPEPA